METHGTLNYGGLVVQIVVIHRILVRNSVGSPRVYFCTPCALVLFRLKIGIIPTLLGCSLAGFVGLVFCVARRDANSHNFLSRNATNENPAFRAIPGRRG